MFTVVCDDTGLNAADNLVLPRLYFPRECLAVQPSVRTVET